MLRYTIKLKLPMRRTSPLCLFACRYEKLEQKNVSAECQTMMALTASAGEWQRDAVRELLQRFFSQAHAINNPSSWLHRSLQQIGTW